MRHAVLMQALVGCIADGVFVPYMRQTVIDALAEEGLTLANPLAVLSRNAKGQWDVDLTDVLVLFSREKAEA